MPARRNASRVSPLWLLWLSPLLLLAPVWLGGRALYWGTHSTQFVPWWWQAWLTLRGGEWPLWNPLVGMGAPLLANYQSAIFYPPNWTYFMLAAVGGLPWMAWGQAILVAAHLGWAGWGMARLLQKLGVRQLGQLVGGLAFGLCGYLVARAQFLSINSTLAWLPWVLLAAYEAASEKQGRRPVLKLALVLALQWLAGHAQLSAYTVLLAAAWAAFWSPDLRRTGGRLLAAAGLALALSAVQLLPTLEYLLHSARAEQVAPQLAMTYSFWPWRLLGLLAPNVFGSPASGNYAGYGNYWEDAIYIGLLPLFLAVLAVVSRQSEGVGNGSRNLRRFLLGVIFVSVLLGLGANAPVFPWLYAHVPGFDLFQAPSRFMIWAVFALAVLAATGAERWRQPAGRGLYWSRLALAAGLAISLGGLAAGALQAAGRLSMPPAFAAAAVALGLNAMALAALNLWVWRLPAARRTWLVGLVVAADLLAALWGLLPGADLAFYAQTPGRAELRAQLGAGRLYLPAEGEARLKFQRLFRFDTFFAVEPTEIRSSLLPNTNLLEGLPSANNFDPLVPQRYQEWNDALADSFPTYQFTMLGLMNVSVVEQVDASGRVTFISVPSLPRARLVSCAQVAASPQAALRTLTELDPRDAVVIEGAPELAGCAAAGGQAAILQASANRVVVSVDGAGWLVLADTWYPGWRAFAGTQELAIHPAYGLFRAVQVPAGVTQVEFVYRPASFTIGLLLTLAAWPLWLFEWRRDTR